MPYPGHTTEEVARRKIYEAVGLSKATIYRYLKPDAPRQREAS